MVKNKSSYTEILFLKGNILQLIQKCISYSDGKGSIYQRNLKHSQDRYPSTQLNTELTMTCYVDTSKVCNFINMLTFGINKNFHGSTTAIILVMLDTNFWQRTDIWTYRWTIKGKSISPNPPKWWGHNSCIKLRAKQIRKSYIKFLFSIRNIYWQP